MASFHAFFNVVPFRLFLPAAWPLAVIVLFDLGLIWILKGFFLALQNPESAAVSRPFSFFLNPAGSDPMSALLVAALVTLTYTLVRAGLVYWLWTRVTHTLGRAQAHVSKGLFHRFLWQNYLEARGASLSERKQLMMVSAVGLFHQILMPLGLLLGESVVALAIVTLLLVWDPVPTLCLMVWLALCLALATRLRARRSVAAGEERWSAFHRMRVLIDNALGDLVAIRVTAAERDLERLFAQAVERHADATVSERSIAMCNRHFLEVGLVSAILVVLLSMIALERPAEALLPTLVVFAAAAIRVLPIGLRGVAVTHILMSNALDLGALGRSLHLPIAVLPQPARGSQRPRAPFARSLELKDIRFHYPQDKHDSLVIEGLTIRRGERIWIRGRSGAGKSTLLAHILGLIEVPAGHGLLDGKATPFLPAMRDAAVGLVPQAPLILNASVAENILFPDTEGKPEEARIRAILEALDLDLSLDRPVGEQGQQVSGGQAQRLAVARMLYAAPELVVLDEATSDLDPASAERVFAALETFCPDATVIVVSHGTEVPRRFSRLLTLSEGRILEEAVANR